MMRIKSGALLALALAAAPMPALAEDRIVDISSVASVAELLKEAGYRAEIKTGNDGTKYISSAANGGNFSLYFYGCKDDAGCDSLEFYSWYKKEPYFSLDLVNEWNRDKRFLKIAIDKDGDLVEYVYVSALGKTTYANFVDYIDWFTSMDGTLAKFLESKKPTETPAKK